MAEIKLIKNTLRATAADLLPDQTIDERYWRRLIIQNLLQPSSSMNAKELKDFMIVEGSFIIEVVEASWLEPYQRMKPRQS